MIRSALLALIAGTSAAPTAAEVLLSWPVDCDNGRTCFIEDYVDATPGPGMSDFMCGLKSRDAHSGTDIALLSDAQRLAGVDVLAAAPGRIAALRDGVEDRRMDNAEAISGIECGNAVRLDHGDGLQTLYCHLAKGSLTVAEGDSVERGQALGRIGLSGQTNYPHLHFTVLRDGESIDPFDYKASGICGATAPTLWEDAPPYVETGLFTAGFSNRVPEFSEVQNGDARVDGLAADTALVLYAHMFHAERADVLHLEAKGPDGSVFDHSILVKTDDAQAFRAFGRRAPEEGWPSGDYTGTARLMRGETVIAVRHAYVSVR